MWSILILLSLLITFFICVKLSVYDTNNGWIALLGLLSIFTVIAGSITLVVYSCKVPTISVDEKQHIDIVTINNGSELNGQFYLFGGYINEKQVYYYFKKTNNGGFIQESISATNVIIYQDTVDTGYISITTNHEYVEPEFAKKYKGWVIYCGEYFTLIPQQVEIHVPPNTILQEFKLDLGNN